jgi:uncharacterized protein
LFFGNYQTGGEDSMKPTKSEYMLIRRSKIHNNGAFAKKNIPEGAKIIEYVGPKLTKSQAEKRSDELLEAAKKNKSNGSVYLFELNKRYDLDGSVSWNTARWINHSCDPNCEIEISRGHIWVTALRDIKKGAELFYNYGYDLDDFEDHPCRCGTKKCVGYIADEDFWPRLRRKLEKKKRN